VAWNEGHKWRDYTPGAAGNESLVAQVLMHRIRLICTMGEDWQEHIEPAAHTATFSLPAKRNSRVGRRGFVETHYGS